MATKSANALFAAFREAGMSVVDEMEETYQYLPESTKAYVLDEWWPKRTKSSQLIEFVNWFIFTVEGSVKLQLKDKYSEEFASLVSEVNWIEKSPSLMRDFIFPINKFKDDYVQIAKIVDSFLEKKLKDPLRLQDEYAEEPKLYADAAERNNKLIGQLKELRRCNADFLKEHAENRMNLKEKTDTTEIKKI